MHLESTSVLEKVAPNTVYMCSVSRQPNADHHCSTWTPWVHCIISLKTTRHRWPPVASGLPISVVSSIRVSPRILWTGQMSLGVYRFQNITWLFNSMTSELTNDQFDSFIDFGLRTAWCKVALEYTKKAEKLQLPLPSQDALLYRICLASNLWHFNFQLWLYCIWECIICNLPVECQATDNVIDTNAFLKISPW